MSSEVRTLKYFRVQKSSAVMRTFVLLLLLNRVLKQYVKLKVI